MSEETIYICDRCHREARVDRSYWQDLKYKNLINYIFCPKCASEFAVFLLNKPTETTYIEG